MAENKYSGHDVFISYHTQSAGDIVRKITAALEGAGIRCWYAPRNVGANYAQSIVEAIRTCRVFLLILNEQSNLSAHVMNEVNCAFNRFKNHEDITLLPFRIDECQLSDDAYYYLGRIHIMDGALPPEVQRVRELVDRVSTILGRGPERTVTLPAAGYDAPRSRTAPASAEPERTVYRLTGSMVYPDSRFVGRERELEAIREALAGPENKAFLVGMGGIGKSEIAKMYLKRCQADHDVILWVSFAGSLEQTLANDFAVPIQGMSRSLYPEYTDRAYFQRKLRLLQQIADRRVLIVMDNFDAPDDADLERFCGGPYTVLFTTRRHQQRVSLPEIEVREMTDEGELLALFRAEYSRPLDEAGLAHVRRIIRRLGGHTLSVRLVGSAMQHRRIPPEKMDELLESGAAGMARSNGRAADMIFGQLRQVFQLSTLSEEEQYLLKNLALVPLRGIGVETLYDWCGAEDFDVIDALIEKSWVAHDPAADEVHLHPLVAELSQQLLEQDPDSCTAFLQALVNAAETISARDHAWRQRVLDIADTASERLPAGHPMRWQTLRAQARASMELCHYRSCERICRQMLCTAQTLEDKLYVYNKLALLAALSGDRVGCRRIAGEGYALVEDTPLDELSPTEGYLRQELILRLSESDRDLGDYDEAIRYARMAVALEGRYYEFTPERTYGWGEYHLGRSLYMAGRMEEAETHMEHALDLFRQIGDEWSCAFAYEIQGQIYMRQGRSDEALACNSRAMDMLLPMLGELHRDIGENLEFEANIRHAMGDAAGAAGCLARAASIYRQLHLARQEAAVAARLEQLRD